MPLANFTVKIEKKEDALALNREDLQKALDERREALDTIWREAGPDYDASKVTVIDVKDGADLVNQVNQRDEELNWLGERQKFFDDMDASRRRNDAWKNQPSGPAGRDFAPRGDDGPAPRGAIKGIGQLFVASEAYNLARPASVGGSKKVNERVEIDGSPVQLLGLRPVNATFLTTAGWAPETLRTGRIVLDEQREIEVTDMLPVFPTNQAAIVYMEETTFTNNAAERNENADYVEAALALTERSVTVRSIGDSLPVTDEQLMDVEGVAAYLDSRLGFMVKQRLDSQILVGDGVAPNLAGTLNVAGINTQAKGTDTIIDATYKAIKAARVTGRAQPSAAFYHPNDWQDVALMKTTDGVYIWGNPMDGGPRRIWGLPVVETTAITENTGLVGDYARFSGLHMRTGLEVLTGFVNDDFKKGRVTVRAGVRVAVVHYRPAAFTQITGL